MIWDPKALLKGKHKEQATKDNHLTDALLYSHHGSRHWWYRADPVKDFDADEMHTYNIEKKFGNNSNKPKMKLFKKPWWDSEDAV